MSTFNESGLGARLHPLSERAARDEAVTPFGTPPLVVG